MFPLSLFYGIITVACGKSSISLACGDRIVRPARSTKRSSKQKEKKWNKERKEEKQNEWEEGPLCPRLFLPTPPSFRPVLILAPFLSTYGTGYIYNYKFD